MSIDIMKQRAFGTTNNAILGSLSRNAPTSSQFHVSRALLGIPTEKTLHAFIQEAQEKLEIEDIDDDELMKSFLEIEPRYSNLYRKLAEL